MKAYLFLDELGEEALGLNGRDITTEVAPDQNAAFDIEKEKSRHSPRHRSVARVCTYLSDRRCKELIGSQVEESRVN